MVKVFGCRPSQVVRLGSGRRTETARVRTRGGRARCYGDLRIWVSWCGWGGECEPVLAGDGEERERSVGRRAGRCHSGGEADLAIIGTLVELSADLST